MIIGCLLAMCDVRPQQLLRKISPSKQLAVIRPNHAGMILIWPSFIIVQMVLVHCISSSHRLKKIFEMKIVIIFLSETTRSRALIFVMSHQLDDLYKVNSSYATGTKSGPPRGSHVLHSLLRKT